MTIVDQLRRQRDIARQNFRRLDELAADLEAEHARVVHDLTIANGNRHRLEAELESAHAWLDHDGVPRSDDHGGPLSLALRIAIARDAAMDAARNAGDALTGERDST